MHIDATVTMIEAIRPSYIFPQHFGPYQVTEQLLDSWLSVRGQG